MPRPRVCIVTPALASANNGNWQTARRWARMLGGDYRVEVLAQWQGEAADLLVALHARRSAASIERWAMQSPHRPLVVVLTGTDLYRDIAVDAAAQRSLALADTLVVLHERAVDDLPPHFRAKAIACFQSTTARVTLKKSPGHLRCVMVGHLREEKAPETFFAAARRLSARPDILLDHIGEALDPALGAQARALQRHCPAYRWLGALPREATRRRIQRAHLLVNTSRMEGGAHVVMEAVRSGTPVLATRIAGNVGMLGPFYAGYFEPGDGAGLADLIARCHDQPPVLHALGAQWHNGHLFEPSREHATLVSLLKDLLPRAG